MEEKIEMDATELSITSRVAIVTELNKLLNGRTGLVQIGDILIDASNISYIALYKLVGDDELIVDIGQKDSHSICARIPFSTEASELPPAENSETED